MKQSQNIFALQARGLRATHAKLFAVLGMVMIVAVLAAQLLPYCDALLDQSMVECVDFEENEGEERDTEEEKAEQEKYKAGAQAEFIASISLDQCTDDDWQYPVSTPYLETLSPPPDLL